MFVAHPCTITWRSIYNLHVECEGHTYIGHEHNPIEIPNSLTFTLFELTLFRRLCYMIDVPIHKTLKHAIFATPQQYIVEKEGHTPRNTTFARLENGFFRLNEVTSRIRARIIRREKSFTKGWDRHSLRVESDKYIFVATLLDRCRFPAPKGYNKKRNTKK